MPLTHDFLLEIGTEELPARALFPLAQALCQQLTTQLHKAELTFATAQPYATPRRLAVLITGLAAAQASHTIERKGPALNAAFDAAGKPTPACLGFARSCGVTVEQLQTVKSDKGEWLVYRYEQPGGSAKKLLPVLAQQAITQLPIPRPMRWGAQRVSFLRPVHWVVMLLDKELLEAELFNLPTTGHTYGHRFHHPQSLAIPHAKDYATVLATHGKVIADFNQRQALIRSQLQTVAADKGSVLLDEELLEEVTGLVEWPVALLVDFAPHFLEMPPEVLITAMKHHQKSFALTDSNQRLLPHFITIANIESRQPQAVITGNERVMEARLADAEFFYHSDRKHRLESRLEHLHTVIFQQQLGTLYDKAVRLSNLAAHIAELLNVNRDHAARAGLLAKADLVSAMVGEFPELQGVMGYYYALQDNEPHAVAVAIKEHYQPRSANDALPETLLGCALAIADKLDTLLGIFGINQAPTGDKDPFGLRRAAVGILRIIIQQQLPLDLKSLLVEAQRHYQNPLPNAQAAKQALNFIFERLRAWYAEQQITADVFAAVMARYPTQPWDFHQRIQAVQYFKQLPEAAALTAANKRVSNILKKQDGVSLHAQVNPALLENAAERTLENLLTQKNKDVEQLCQQARYTDALSALALLREPVDRFFDEVLVMAPDEKLRHNRLALLNQLHQLFCQVADISLLQ